MVDFTRVFNGVRRFVLSRIYGNRPFMEFMYLFVLVYAVLDAVIIGWFFLAPYAVQSENRFLFGLGMIAYNLGYLTSNCHQLPQRSFILGGVAMPFCARDTGVYLGCLVGAILPVSSVRLPRFTRSLAFTCLLMAPMVFDGVSQTIFEARESSNSLRVASGFLFGFAIVYYVFARVVEHSGKWVDSHLELAKAARIGAVSLFALLAAAYVSSNWYVTEAEAVKLSGLNPSFVTYVSKRVFQTLPYDPYLDLYDDAVLDELLKYGFRGHGVWVVYEGRMRYEGKYVFFSGGEGRFKLVPDVRP